MSVDEIRNALTTLLTDENERAQLRMEGPKRAEQLTWKNHARILSEVLIHNSQFIIHNYYMVDSFHSASICFIISKLLYNRKL